MYTKAIIASALVGLAAAVPQSQVVSQNANVRMPTHPPQLDLS